MAEASWTSNSKVLDIRDRQKGSGTGIRLQNSRLALDDVKISRTSSAIYMQRQWMDVEIHDSVISRSSYGIYDDELGGTLTVTDSRFNSNNSAIELPRLTGGVAIDNTTFSNNFSAINAVAPFAYAESYSGLVVVGSRFLSNFYGVQGGGNRSAPPDSSGTSFRGAAASGTSAAIRG